MSGDSLEALVARALCHYPSGPSDFNSCCAAEMGEKRCQIGARAALAAIEASGTHVLAEVEPVGLEQVVKDDFLRWCVYGGYTDEAKLAEWFRMRNIELEQFRRRYSALLAARPRDAAAADESRRRKVIEDACDRAFGPRDAAPTGESDGT